MSYKQKIGSLVAAGFAIVSFSAFASAQDTTTTQSNDSMQKQERRERRGFGKRDGEKRGGRHLGGGGKMGMRGLRELNLTDAQRQQVREIMESSRAANQGSHQELRQLMEARRSGGGAALTADQQQRFETLRQQMRQNAEQTHERVLAILTAEQRTQLEQLKAQKQQKMQERRQMRRSRQNSDIPATDN